MKHPDWFAFVMLAAAAFRTWKLVADDSILDRPRAWLLRLGDWEPGDPTPSGYRSRLADFITCPWCAGFWIVVAWWLAWWAWPAAAVWFAVPWAMSAVVGLVATERSS